MMEKTIKVQLARKADSDLIIAFSDELPGFMVQGRSLEQILERAPALMEQIILEREGLTVAVSIKKRDLAPFEVGCFETMVQPVAA